MEMAHRAPRITRATQPITDIETDVVVLPVFEDDTLAALPTIELATAGETARARARGEVTGKLYETFVCPVVADGFRASRVMLIGGGKQADLTTQRLRRMATAAGLGARQRRATRLAFVDRGVAAVEGRAQALAEGLALANYDGRTYKTTPTPPRVFLDEAVVATQEPNADAALRAGATQGRWTNEARALANVPGNDLTPQRFVEQATGLLAGTSITTDVLDEDALRRLGMGLLLGVAQGSVEPPRMLIMRHEPASAAPGVVLGLVGKGITFDSGGISIKPAENMHRMKDDMSGGAAVVCAMAAIAELDLPVRCIGVVPLAENMPGGRAMKPGDVLTSAAGKTVEILNTDAEGRLALGDAVWYAREHGATHIVDVATLTGACVVALGYSTSGLFGTPEAWVGHVHAASERAGDRLWPMPVFDDYAERLKSDIADMTNTGGRPGGAITGALFIKAFAGDLPWAHIDIAGTAWAEESTPYQPAGATGVGVRTLVELARDAATWSHAR